MQIEGLKKGSLYVVKNTNSPAILVECGFIDNDGDMALYNTEAIAKAIFTGITGNIDNSYNNDTEEKKSGQDNWIIRLQQECNNQGFSLQNIDGIPGEITLSGCPLIREGAQGRITKLLQEKLISLGYNCGKFGSDGIWGSDTTTSVKSFQRNNNLSSDGIVGKNTWHKLIYI